MTPEERYHFWLGILAGLSLANAPEEQLDEARLKVSMLRMELSDDRN